MKATRLLLLFVLLIPAADVGLASAYAGAPVLRSHRAEKFVRTELYFGLTRSDKSTLTDDEWSLFVDEIITPRFPDGFTVVDGKGQWRNKEGKIAKENSKVFILVYSRKERAAAGKKIDEIREEYKKRFDQESVLRVDITKSILVSF
jgi:hypothetical protein